MRHNSTAAVYGPTEDHPPRDQSSIFRCGPSSTYQERSFLVESPERKQLEWDYNISDDGGTTGSLSGHGPWEVDLDGKASIKCTAPP